MGFILRKYQADAVEVGIETAKSKTRGILVLPTGSGKSLVIANIAKKMEGKTLIFQPSKEILEQNLAKMLSYGERDIGVYSASMDSRTFGKITFATIGSIANKDELFKNFNYILIDECHLVNSKDGMYENFINSLDVPTIGLTATPFRLRSRRDLDGNTVSESKILTRTRPKIFKKIVHITQIKELYDLGFLAPLNYITTGYDQRDIRSNTTKSGFDEDSLREYNRRAQLNERVVQRLMKSESRYKLVFNQFVDDSTAIQEELKRYSVDSFQVSAKTKKKDREEILERFKSGDISNILNVGVLTVGFDFPELDEIVLSRPTKSVALYYQMIGRGIRVCPGKKGCTLVDFCGNVKRFGRIETFEFVDVNGNQMWKLKSDRGFLTGVDADTNYDLESVKKRTELSTGKNNGVMVTFGKHSGKRVSKLPIAYLLWCVETFKDGQWKTAFQKELERRRAA